MRNWHSKKGTVLFEEERFLLATLQQLRQFAEVFGGEDGDFIVH
jgi:hypothetical protein